MRPPRTVRTDRSRSPTRAPPAAAPRATARTARPGPPAAGRNRGRRTARVSPRSRRSNSRRPSGSSTTGMSATGTSEAQSDWPASGRWSPVQAHGVSHANGWNSGTDGAYPLMIQPANSSPPLIAAPAPRPTTWDSANARPPTPAPSRRSTPRTRRARSSGIASPGRLPNAAPATHVAAASATSTTAINVRCAATFSPASRRRPMGVTARTSRLPRRASPASVPDSARMLQSAAIQTKNAPYFHCAYPPSVRHVHRLARQPLRDGAHVRGQARHLVACLLRGERGGDRGGDAEHHPRGQPQHDQERRAARPGSTWHRPTRTHRPGATAGGGGGQQGQAGVGPATAVMAGAPTGWSGPEPGRSGPRTRPGRSPPGRARGSRSRAAHGAPPPGRRA